MMALKYVRYRVFDDDRVVLFDQNEPHHNMMFRMNIDSKDIISAGMVDIRAGRVVVSGESTTLQRSPSPEDIELITRKLID